MDGQIICVKVGNWEGLAQTKLDRVLSECSLIICLRSFLSIQVFSLLFWKEIDHFVCVYELYKFWQLILSWYFTLNDTHKSTLPVDLDEMAILWLDMSLVLCIMMLKRLTGKKWLDFKSRIWNVILWWLRWTWFKALCLSSCCSSKTQQRLKHFISS